MNNYNTDHLLEVPSQRADGHLAYHQGGRHCRRPADVGMDDIGLASGQNSFIGDTIMVAASDDNEEGSPARLGGAFPALLRPGRRRDTGTTRSADSCPSCELSAEIRPFRLPASVIGGKSTKKSLPARLRDDVSDESIKAKAVGLLRQLRRVVPERDSSPSNRQERPPPSNTSIVAGFVEKREAGRQGGGRYSILPVPWRQGGPERSGLDIRSLVVYVNNSGTAIAYVRMCLSATLSALFNGW